MSQSTDGLLAYGYDLGCSEEWKVREATGEYGELVLPWYTEEDDEGEGGEGGDFPDAAQKTLRAAGGFTGDGYDGRREADERTGVTIETYCSDGYPMYVLSAKTLEAGRGDIIDATESLGADRSAWDERLAWALKALGLTPVQEKPAWLLCSYADGF